jgi:fatty acid desaturase
MWAPLEALEPLWVKEARWKRRSRQRRAEIGQRVAELRERQDKIERQREHGHMAVRGATVGGGGLVGLFIGGAAWPVWWPAWTAWAYLAAGTALGVCIVELGWRRLKR